VTIPGIARTDDSRLAHERWRTWVPLAAVICALVALVALPVLRTMQLRPFYEEMRDVNEPSRSLLSRIHSALALEQSLLRDFVEGGDTVAARRYAAAVAEERAAYAELTPLVRKLGPEVERKFTQHRELERAWHGEIQQLLSRPDTERRKRDPMHARRYEDLLVSAAGLDEALNAAAGSRRAALEATGRAQIWISFAIGVIALAAALLVAWLGRRLRTFAVKEESARLRLEEAIESRARLIRGITHDLKNPLQVISAGAEIVGEEILGPVNERQRDTIDRIRSSARHLLSMVTDLLQMSMAEGGTLAIRPVRTSIRDVVLESTKDYAAPASAKGLSLNVHLNEDPLEAMTDPLRVGQILQNLISNAIKYTPTGGSVSVRAGERTRTTGVAGMGMVAIDVADSGEGIPEDHLEGIFDEFSRLDAHRTLPGAGLGLAIARRIAVLLGGNVTVESSPAGSIFTLWLPRDRRQLPSMHDGAVEMDSSKT